MLLPDDHYPQFSDCDTLEKLVLQLGREILEQYKILGNNSSNVEIIDITGSEKAETISLTTNSWVANIDNGLIVVSNPFPSHSFTTGTGIYPFNQSTLVNAFFHCAMYLQKQELSVSKNVGSKQCINFDITSVTAIGDSQQLDVSVEITDFPIVINNSNNLTTSLAKTYILD